MYTSHSETVMSTATGFLYEHQDEIFLITNGHNVTRIHPDTKERIFNSAAFPTMIRSKAKTKIDDQVGLSEFFTVKLYDDEDFTIPRWYVHPEFGYQVDVVAIPLDRKANIPDHVIIVPLNTLRFDEQYPIRVADDVFILGYPLDIKGHGELPIWKRGTIASEPDVEINGLPKMLVDTATRSGMSGSPVIMRRTGFHSSQSIEDQNKNGLHPTDLVGTIENFVGVYSGRIGSDNEFQAQLGIVWKKEVISKILDNKQLGTIEFQNQ